MCRGQQELTEWDKGVYSREIYENRTKFDVLEMETEVLKRTEEDQTIIHSIFIQYFRAYTLCQARLQGLI